MCPALFSILEVSCDYDTLVNKGQVCAEIDPRPYQTQVDQNRATSKSSWFDWIRTKKV